MNTIQVRVDLRLTRDIVEFLQEESRLKKLSFEGLILLYIRDRMKRERER